MRKTIESDEESEHGQAPKLKRESHQLWIEVKQIQRKSKKEKIHRNTSDSEYAPGGSETRVIWEKTLQELLQVRPKSVEIQLT